jgi:thiol-disulfide isomerase/thioredoxin
MTDQPDGSLHEHRRRRWVAAAVLLALGGAVAGAVYGIGSVGRNPGAAACRSAVELAKRVAPLVRGEVAALAVAEKPLQLPNLAFNDEAGRAHSLADWQGRFVLFNLWATWCVPCRKEMPALDALEAKLGGRDFEVVAVNIDTRDPDKPRAWLKEVGVTRLAYYADPTAKVFQDLKLVGRAFGMPTTLIVDPAGCEIGTAAGPAEWASEDAVKLISMALGRSS